VFSLTYSLIGQGWCQATLRDGAHEVSIRATYLTDALRDLVDAVIAVMRGASHVACTWQDEPGEHRWLFDRQDADEVTITIRRFDSTFSRQSDELGEIIFTARCPQRRLAGQLLTQMWHLLNDQGLEGYRGLW
jgi:hypothetical protein